MNTSQFFPSARAEVLLRQGSSRSRTGEAHVVLPAKECLIQVADVPSVDAEELEGMMALRAEDVSPFPMDRTHWGWEVVSQSESESRVLFVLTGHRLLDALHEEGAEQQVVPHRVDVDVLAWWSLIAEADKREDAVSRLVLVVEADQSFLFALEAGVLAAVVSLGDPYDCDVEVYLEELDMALAAIEAERGALSFAELTVWEHGDTAEGVDVSVFKEHLSIPVAVKSLESLPPLTSGVEKRAELSKSKALVDLAPAVWKEEERARALRQRVLKSAVAVGLVWVLLVASFSGYVWSQGRSLAGLEAEIAGQEGAVRDVQRLSDRVRSLSQFTDRSTSALEILRMLAEASPGTGRLLIRDLQYRKDQGVTVSGEASGDFFVFQEMLSESPVLRVETFETREVRGQTEFRLASVWRWREEEL
ncbi:MAG: hypothetical protein JJU05_18350 [Verrucomicrobia bacterium]|nr:hypothetical protein [Verrucomicrobiota bacterium]MCH8529116.1 hypothetical protein [Kiritimatiellia bacterium]